MKSSKLFNEIINSDNFISIMDDGYWEYDRFGFGEIDDKCYYVDLEGNECDDDVFELKEGLNVKGILEEGVNKGLLDNDDLCYFEEVEEEVMNWVWSLKK